jgi:hypothetical protein
MFRLSRCAVCLPRLSTLRTPSAAFTFVDNAHRGGRRALPVLPRPAIRHIHAGRECSRELRPGPVQQRLDGQVQRPVARRFKAAVDRRG